ncbi:hypothetical protein B9P52_04500 [Achromobacter denitrificans]|uniref:hypothetical protein n=1 Tax=Achromobacter denitrificans TaxID=32002 RepID=UPI000B4DBC76|nr:hypothetical protein [Achromobacter denitrificans]ASC63597.1 hypothetical protein B9P52_04500 [Achromobacter denitrificans]
MINRDAQLSEIQATLESIDRHLRDQAVSNAQSRKTLKDIDTCLQWIFWGVAITAGAALKLTWDGKWWDSGAAFWVIAALAAVLLFALPFFIARKVMRFNREREARQYAEKRRRLGYDQPESEQK